MNIDLLDYADLPIGETRNGECPTCGKRKFYVTRKQSGLAYICFRASCGTQGYAGGAGPAPIGLSTPKLRLEFKGNLFMPDDEVVAWFEDRFQVDLGDYPEPGYWVKVTDDGRFAFPIWGPMDEYRGIVIRRPTWSDSDLCPLVTDSQPYRVTANCPKSKTFLEPGATKGAWYHSMRENIVVVVEDQVSAMRIASLGVTAYALLGTNFSPQNYKDLQSWKNGETVIIALDRDAYLKSVEIAQAWGPALHTGMKVARLMVDPKDYTKDEDLMRDLGISR